MRLGPARGAAAVATAACLILAGCHGGSGTAAGDSGPPSPTTHPSTSGGTTGRPSSSPPTTSPTPSPHDPAAGMTMAQKVGQLFMTGADANGVAAASYAAITGHHVGNIILTGRSTKGVHGTRRLVKSLRARVGPESTHGVRLLVATDQEGGQVQVLRGPGFSDVPSAVAQGSLGPAALRKRARTWGRQLREAGVDVDLAPVMDTVPSAAFAPRNAPIGAFDRQYGYSPDSVTRHGRAFARGLTDAGVAPVLKHFPGLGRVTANTDTSTGVTDRTTTRHDPYLAPFRAGIRAGATFVMVSTAIYPKVDDRPAAFSSTVIGSVLRDDLGFDGVVISDDLSSARQVARWSPAQRAVKFIAAGGDIVLAVDPSQMPAMTQAVLRKARNSDRFAAKVDAAVARVLAAKER